MREQLCSGTWHNEYSWSLFQSGKEGGDTCRNSPWKDGPQSPLCDLKHVDSSGLWSLYVLPLEVEKEQEEPQKRAAVTDTSDAVTLCADTLPNPIHATPGAKPVRAFLFSVGHLRRQRVGYMAPVIAEWHGHS